MIYFISMQERNYKTFAIVLNIQEQGEHNKTVTLLTPERGIIYATLYGGAKSKLKALVQQFHTGQAWLYSDSAKKLTKISDFEVENSHLSLRNNLFKLWAANLAIEIIIKTHCAGEAFSSCKLLKALLDGMDASSEEEARLGLLRFFWRYIALLGIQPSVNDCVLCGMPLQSATYADSLNGFVCNDCFDKPSDLRLEKEALNYLHAINTESPQKVRSIAIKLESAYQLKKVLYYIIEKAASCKLQALESGKGIL